MLIRNALDSCCNDTRTVETPLKIPFWSEPGDKVGQNASF